MTTAQVVSRMWHEEKPEVKAHFKALADEEERLHKLRYPAYRFGPARRHHMQHFLARRHSIHNPVTMAAKLIVSTL